MLGIEATRVHISRVEWPLLPIVGNYTLLRFQGVGGARVGCKFSLHSGYFLIVGYARSFRRTLLIRLQPQLAKDLVHV